MCIMEFDKMVSTGFYKTSIGFHKVNIIGFYAGC